MTTALYLYETLRLSNILNSVREELTKTIRTALIERAYNTDVQLSFGVIHINSKGSVSKISFNGVDVTDIDSFIAKQAFRVDDENYFDIRTVVKNRPDDFCYYPIQIDGRLSLTVLKTSPYFERKYGSIIHSDSFRVEYASKYLVIYRSSNAVPEVYCVGLFTPEATANTLLEKAGKHLGGKTDIYYCFMNSRPEQFLHIGQVKRDFCAYHPEKNPEAYNFYKGSIISGIFKINKQTDINGKIKVKDTKRKSLQKIIKMQYGTVKNFCNLNDIDMLFMTAFLSGADAEIKYKNGNTVTPTRLEEILNLPFSPNAESLKDKNLLVKIEYDDIPA